MRGDIRRRVWFERTPHYHIDHGNEFSLCMREEVEGLGTRKVMRFEWVETEERALEPSEILPLSGTDAEYIAQTLWDHGIRPREALNHDEAIAHLQELRFVNGPMTSDEAIAALREWEHNR